jgi:hypothetical protein
MGPKRASIAVALALCALGALSCSSSTSPTAPGTSAITLTVSVTNTTGAATLDEVQATLDGALFIDTISAAPLPIFTLVGSRNLASGTHTLTVVIVQQSTSPSSYTVAPTIEVMSPGGTVVNTILPVAQTLSLATGAVVTFSFTF